MAPQVTALGITPNQSATRGVIEPQRRSFQRPKIGGVCAPIHAVFLYFGQQQFVVCGIDDAYQHGAATVAFQAVGLEPTGIDAWRVCSKELEPPVAFGTLDQLKTRQRNGRVLGRRAHRRSSSR